jgi:hypothetical protein
LYTYSAAPSRACRPGRAKIVGKNRAKGKNAAKVQELFETHNDYPAEVSALICCFQIVDTDFFFLQAASEIKKQVELKMGPFATFNDTY